MFLVALPPPKKIKEANYWRWVGHLHAMDPAPPHAGLVARDLAPGSGDPQSDAPSSWPCDQGDAFFEVAKT